MLLVIALQPGPVGLRGWAASPVGVVIALVFAAGGFDYLSPDSGPLSALEAAGGVLALLYVLLISIGLLRRPGALHSEARPTTEWA